MEAVTLTYEELRALDNERLLDLDYAAGVALEDLEGSFGAQVFEAKLPASVKDYELDQFRGMDRLTKSLQDGKITASEYGRQAHGLIHKNFEGAYRAGKGRALDDGDMEYIRRATDAELKYAVRFGNDVEAGRLVMPRVKRAGMYGRTVGAIAWHGNVEAQPDNVRIHWQLGVAEHCVDCLILACFLSDLILISTARGDVPLRDVRIGDEVLTHRGRWRKVEAKPVRTAQPHHRMAVLVTEDGLHGLTDDHRLFTERGWMPAKEVSREGLRCLCRLRDEDRQEGEAVQVVRREAEGQEDGVRGSQVGGLQAGAEEEPARGELLEGRQAEDGVAAQVGVGDGEWSSAGRDGGAPQERGAVGRPTGEPGAEDEGDAYRRPSPGAIESDVEGCDGDVEVCQLRDEVQALPKREQEVLQPRVLGGLADGEVGRRSGMRTLREGVHDEDGTPKAEVREEGQPSGVLLSELLPGEPVGGELREEDPAVRLLRERVRSGEVQDRCVEVGEVLLLKAVLPEGSQLYDLTVEEDHSFVAGSLVVHNSSSPYTKWDLPTTPGAGATKCLSNCQCTLRYVVGKQTREEREDAEDYGTRKGQTLSDLLAPGPVPRGLRLPTAPEAFYVDRLRNRINYWRRRVALAVSEDEVKHAAGMRMRFNDELIEFTEKNKIHEVPVWSVDDVLDGRHIGNRAVKDIFRHGLDGRSLSAVSQKRLLSMLNDYEDEFGTVFSDDAIIDGLLED